MKRTLITFVVFLVFATFAKPQTGRFLIVGGGSEKNGANSWNVPAYKWAVQGKRVAVIGASTGSLAPYLKQYCGASFAREFGVSSRDSADSQILYDTLKTYDVIFFRGGDQYDYYRFYKDTKLQQAAQELFAKGGTLAGTSAGMHILSSVVFTAKNGTVYPYEAIENPQNGYMTLADDFFDFFPGFIFDTHFSERARFGRLAGFLAKYHLDHQLMLTGLGMDDMTCMTVDENRIGTVYGTGCANIFNFTDPFSLNGTKLLHPGLQVKQLIQGCTYNFNTAEVTIPTLDRLLPTNEMEETGNFTLLASGGNTLSNNTAMLNDLVNLSGNLSDQVLLMTGNENTAQTFKNQLITLGLPDVDVFLMNNTNGSNTALADKINAAGKLLFVANTTEALIDFLTTPNGELLKSRLHSPGIIAAFAGDDARFAGKIVVDNYYTELASWYGELTFSPGFGMLRNSMIMPNTYFHADFYENTATAIPYGMATDTLRYGIWLTAKNYLKVQPIDGKTTLFGYGQHPIMILRNEGGAAALVTQTGSGSSSATPRMEAGFEQLTLSFVDETLPYILGTTDASALDENANKVFFKLSGNPVSDVLLVETNFSSYDWKIVDSMGRFIKGGHAQNSIMPLSLSYLSSGIYSIQLKETATGKIVSSKFIKL